MSSAVKKSIGDRIDKTKRQVKLVAGLLAGVFLLSLFARGHFNSGGEPTPTTVVEPEPKGLPEGHSMCVLGTPECEGFETDPGVEVVVIPAQGSTWCPPGSDTCVEFAPVGGGADG